MEVIILSSGFFPLRSFFIVASFYFSTFIMYFMNEFNFSY